MQQFNPVPKFQKSLQPRASSWLARLILIAFIFSFGFGVGSGRLGFKINKDTLSSVQKNELPADLDYAGVEEVYDALKQSYDGQLSNQELVDGLKEGLAKATGDSYTEYFNDVEAKEFDADLSGTFSGIGAELSKEKDTMVIIAPIAGYPAEKAGLKPKDIIAEIDGESAYDLTVSEAVKKIRGPVDTKVKLKIIREGQAPLDFEITRQTITIPSVESEILDGNIGYMKISRFGDDTTGLARNAAQKFKDAGVKGVILDVRSDPGGLLESAVDVSSLWLQNKLVLQEKRADTVVKTYNSRGNATLLNIPTVVLVNEGSASASEITAGALKDNGAATLIGVKTFGKGSVQQLIDLKKCGNSKHLDDVIDYSCGVLKVTIARWYTPAGKNIDKEGISPDQEVKRTEDDYKANRDPQKDAAIQYLKK